MKSRNFAIGCLALCVLFTFGCGSKADTNKPMDQVVAEAQKMDAKQLESTAKAYAKEIAAQKEELNKVKDQLKELKPTELLGEKAKSIKDEASEVGKQISELTKRYDVYVKQLKEKGGDLSAVKI